VGDQEERGVLAQAPERHPAGAVDEYRGVVGHVPGAVDQTFVVERDVEVHDEYSGKRSVVRVVPGAFLTSLL
jgi:hypothetical protein